MVISFKDERVRNHLLDNGMVYTYRKGYKRRKQLGNDWANSGRLTKKIADVTVNAIDPVMDVELHDALQSYVDKSGFKSTGDWINSIYKLNKKIPLCGWIYRVDIRVDIER